MPLEKVAKTDCFGGYVKKTVPHMGLLSLDWDGLLTDERK